MAAIKFTPEQRRAIETVDRNLIVSAAAGSGKTAVLAARCAYLVCDVPPPFRCDVDALLVVTFTEAAAAEMKERIGKAIRERCAQAPQDSRLRAQLALVDTAQISTLHAFCLWMVRRWFDRVGIDATAQLLDADEARLLRQDALNAVFERLYAETSPLAQRFRDLVDDYGLGYDGSIGEFILRLEAFAASQEDPETWLAAARDTSPQRLELVLAESRRALSEELARQAARCGELIQVIHGCFPTGAFYANLINEYAMQLSAWNRRIAAGEDWDLVRAEIAAHKLSSKGAPRLSKDTSEHEVMQRDRARKLFTLVSDQLFLKRLRSPLCRFSAQEIAAGFAQTAPCLETLADLVRTFAEQYAKSKRGLDVMDFTDLERFAHQLLTRDASVRAALRHRFAHVLVDEYQDINPLQAAILAAVSREGRDAGGSGGNLFTVGDVKQSIYRFRLAEPEMFTRRAGALRAGIGGECIDLQRNYRSRRRILDAVNAIFRPLMHADCGGIAYDEHAELRHAAPDEPPGDPVELHILDRDADKPADDEDASAGDEPRYVDPGDPAQWEGVMREAHLIGLRIRELIAAKTMIGQGDARRPLEFGDVAVLLRSVRHSAAPLANMLRQMGIPAWTEAGAGLFEAREIRDVLALLAVLDNARQDIPLASVLRSGILGEALSEDELATIRARARGPFHDVVAGYAERGADPALRDKLGRIFAAIARYRREMRERPLADVLWMIYRETGYFAHVGGWRDGDQRRANLVALHERARQFGSFRRQGLRRFLHFIDSLQDEDAELAAPAGLGEVGNAVRVLSIHRAKGLEFPIVFVAELGRQFNLSDLSGRFLYDRRVGVGVKAVDRQRLVEYPTALHRWCARSALEALLAEELRVWYVALTRAREKLILVGSETTENLEHLRAIASASTGPVSPLRILTARRPLEWLLAAQGAMPSGAVTWNQAQPPDDRTLFVCRTYTAEVIRAWSVTSQVVQRTAPLRAAVAALAPLPADEPVSKECTDARRIVDRLDFVYPHLALASIPVACAVSGVQRATLSGEAEEPPVALPIAGETQEEARDRAVRRGQAVHRALEFIDLAGPCNGAAVTRTIDRLVAEGLLAADDAGLIAVDDLVWFFETELGRQVRASAAYHREWMFLATEGPETIDPTVAGDETDRVLIRGVVDGVLVDPAGIEIVDYKTDRVSGAAAAERAQAYAMQLHLYARAVAAVFNRPVIATHLVFLHGRTIISRRELTAPPEPIP